MKQFNENLFYWASVANSFTTEKDIVLQNAFSEQEFEIIAKAGPIHFIYEKDITCDGEMIARKYQEKGGKRKALIFV